jgi:hypothetical protein
MHDMYEWWERTNSTRFRMTTMFFERIYAPLYLLAMAALIVGLTVWVL